MVYKFDPELPAWVHQQQVTPAEAANMLLTMDYVGKTELRWLRYLAHRHLDGRPSKHFIQIRIKSDGTTFFKISTVHAPNGIEVYLSDEDEVSASEDEQSSSEGEASDSNESSRMEQ